MDTNTIGSMSLKGIIEGLVFASGEEGLSVFQIQSVLPSQTRAFLEEQLALLQKEYDEARRGMELVCFAGRWKMIAREEIFPFAAKLYGSMKAPALSPSAMETLALIAYRQPITRVEIEEIRGVGCDVMLKKLQARGLIETCGRKEAAGKPLLYQVTGAFLDAFGLESLEDLPAPAGPSIQETLFAQPESEES